MPGAGNGPCSVPVTPRAASAERLAFQQRSSEGLFGPQATTGESASLGIVLLQSEQRTCSLLYGIKVAC